MYQQPPEGQPPFQQYYPQSQQPGYPPQSGSLQPPQAQSGYLPPQQTPFTPPPAPYVPLQPQKKSKTWLWIVACVICLFLGYAAGSGGKSTSATTTDTTTVAQATPAPTQGKAKAAEPTKAPQSQGHHQVGQTVKTDKWEVTVNKAVASQGTDVFQPKAGNVYLEIDITMKNVTNQTQDASSLLMWNVKSAANGQKQSIALTDKPSLDGKVEAGGSLTGTLTYEVPTSVKKYTLSFEDGMLDNSLELWDISI
jgi:hypothetical protein